MLNATLHGSPTGAPPLVIAHGLFGSARNWGAVARRLAADRLVVAVDMRNHGDSPHAADHSYAAMADDLAGVVDAHGGRADVLGHSMGGKAAMVLALTAPARVRRLVVADMAPVAYGHSQLQYVRAMQAVDLAAVVRRSDADAMLAAAVREPGLRAFLLQSLATGPGGATWKLNLAALADRMPEIMGFPETGGRFPGPTLFVSGGASDYVRPEHWPRIRQLFPAATGTVIPGAGHWLHAEAPGAFVDAVDGFLRAGDGVEAG
jgi:pimeloyl-ACP methyl ester carboxylesterase